MSIVDHQGERARNEAARLTVDEKSGRVRALEDPRHKAYQPSHGRHRDWYYVDDLTPERVADVLSDLKPKQRKAAKVAGYHRSLDAVRFVVWYPAKG